MEPELREVKGGYGGGDDVTNIVSVNVTMFWETGSDFLRSSGDGCVLRCKIGCCRRAGLSYHVLILRRHNDTGSGDLISNSNTFM